MSDEQGPMTASAEADAEQQAQPDDGSPSPERQAALRSAYEANTAAGKAPYAGVDLHTRGEVSWIVEERGWRTSHFETAEQLIDLRGVGLRDAVLSDVDLRWANLSGAIIVQSILSGALFTSANLRDTIIIASAFGNANFIGADLSGALVTGEFTDTVFITANLSRATITGWFSGANLTGANLSGAILGGDFSGANLTQARMDSGTLLGSTKPEAATDTFQLDAWSRVLDVAWNGAILANVPWTHVARLGDEVDIKAAESRAEHVTTLRNAARAYRGLAKALQAQGLTIPALKYRQREQQLERRALLYSFAVGPWLFSWLLNIVSGYGDKPGRALACYLTVVGAYSAMYWAITNQVFGFITSSSSHLAWYEALVLSISSFHGRGFFPSMLSLGDPIALVAAAEAIIGLFIELVFIATFTNRFFAR